MKIEKMMKIENMMKTEKMMKKGMMMVRGMGVVLMGLMALAACARNADGDRQDATVDTTAVADTARAVDSAVGQETRLKKVSILGDSYSTYTGYIPEKNIAWYMPVPKEGRPTDVTKVEQTWWKIFIDRNGYELEKNNSYSGSTVCNTGYGKKDYSDQSFVTRLTDLGDPDMIIIFGGTNDAWADSPIGEYVWSDWTPRQLYSYRPATAYMISKLQELHPDAEIVFLINDEIKDEVKDSTKEICDHYGVKYVQLEGIHKMSDHPDQKGMLQIVDQLEAALK